MMMLYETIMSVMIVVIVLLVVWVIHVSRTVRKNSDSIANNKAVLTDHDRLIEKIDKFLSQEFGEDTDEDESQEGEDNG